MNFERVFSLTPKIRYCAILDDMGRVVAGGMRPGLGSLEPSEEADKVDLQVAVIRGMTEAAHSYLGKTNFVVINRDNVMLVVVPMADKRTVLVTTEPDLPLKDLPPVMDKVKELYRSV